MKKKLALASLASGIASVGLMFNPVTMPYTPFVIGAFAAFGLGLLVTSG